MKKVHVEIGNLVKEYRLKSNLTQLDLAKKLGYDSPQFVSLFERGLSKIPLEALGYLVMTLGIPEKKVKKIILDAFEDEIDCKMNLGKLKNG